jgi:hypothetical protein
MRRGVTIQTKSAEKDGLIYDQICVFVSERLTC